MSGLSLIRLSDTFSHYIGRSIILSPLPILGEGLGEGSLRFSALTDFLRTHKFVQKISSPLFLQSKNVARGNALCELALSCSFALNGSMIEDFSKFYFSKSSSLRPLRTRAKNLFLFRQLKSYRYSRYLAYPELYKSFRF